MADLADSMFEDGPWDRPTLLRRIEAAHSGSARRLRASGREDAARKAERFASWVRFKVDEPKTARRVYALGNELRRCEQPAMMFDKALHGAMSLMGSDQGNIQLVQPDGSLRIVAHHRFDKDFLAYFRVVNDDGSACGRAAHRGDHVVVSDVNADDAFAPHREIASAAGFRGVVSTPLIDYQGRLIGVVSTHYPAPHVPSDRDLRAIRRYAELVAETVVRSSNGEGVSA